MRILVPLRINLSGIFIRYFGMGVLNTISSHIFRRIKANKKFEMNIHPLSSFLMYVCTFKYLVRVQTVWWYPLRREKFGKWDLRGCFIVLSHMSQLFSLDGSALPIAQLFYTYRRSIPLEICKPPIEFWMKRILFVRKFNFDFSFFSSVFNLKCIITIILFHAKNGYFWMRCWPCFWVFPSGVVKSFKFAIFNDTWWRTIA